MTTLHAAATTRERAAHAADWLAALLAASLPFSTSASGILAVAWLAVLIPTLDLAGLRREAASAAGAFVLALCAAAAIGMLWADVDWGERVRGLTPYAKLLVIPLLLFQFRRSGRGWMIALAFLAAATVLLVWSYACTFWPPGMACKDYGVPVKDYITQSGVFVICIFGLADAAMTCWRKRERMIVVAMVALIVVFLANITFVTTGRTALAIVPVLAVMLGWRHFGPKGLLALLVVVATLTLGIWSLSPYLRGRVIGLVTEVQVYETLHDHTSAGQRLEFWKKSLRMVQAAPLIGHGTGSIRDQFSKVVSGTYGPSTLISTNPHQQILAVAIQLGLFGAVLLIAMWCAHGLLFRGAGASSAAWLGLVVVIQNVVGSLFNSHLFDFTQGWIYVVGVGAFGGMVRWQQDCASRSAAKPGA